MNTLKGGDIYTKVDNRKYLINYIGYLGDFRTVLLLKSTVLV